MLYVIFAAVVLDKDSHLTWTWLIQLVCTWIWLTVGGLPEGGGSEGEE